MFTVSLSVEEMFGVVLVEYVFSVDFHIRDMCRVDSCHNFCRCNNNRKKLQLICKHTIFIVHTINPDSCFCCSWWRGISYCIKCRMRFEHWKPCFVPNTTESMGYENVRPDIVQCKVNATSPGTHNLAYILIIQHDSLRYLSCHFFPLPFSHSRRMTVFFFCCCSACICIFDLWRSYWIYVHFLPFFFSSHFLIIHFVVGFSACIFHLNIFFFSNFPLAFNGVPFNPFVTECIVGARWLHAIAHCDGRVRSGRFQLLLVAVPRSSLFIDSKITICNSGEHKNYMSFKE